MTVFNVRLGWWLQNPAQLRQWRHMGPRWGIMYLLSELLGMADDSSKYVYLSDGGHFENLGIYELVRRRCRFIVACDAGMDPGFEFEDLGNAIRKCQVDLGVTIDIDTRPIRPDLVDPARPGSLRGRHHSLRARRQADGRRQGGGGRLSPLHQALHHRERAQRRPPVPGRSRRVPSREHVGPVVRRVPVRELPEARPPHHASRVRRRRHLRAARGGRPRASGAGADVRGPQGALVSVERRGQGRLLEARRPPEHAQGGAAPGRRASASWTPRSTRSGTSS